MNVNQILNVIEEWGIDRDLDIRGYDIINLRKRLDKREKELKKKTVGE